MAIMIRLFTKKPLIFTWKPNDESYIYEIKENLGDATFAWLCACAIFPKLDYNLTILLGKILEEEYSIKLIGTRKFDRLIKLPWFQLGFIPDNYRKILIYSIDLELDEFLREKINSLLNNNSSKNHMDDDLLLSYSNNDISFVLRKEYWRLFGSDGESKDVSFNQMKRLFYVSYLLPSYIIFITLMVIFFVSIASTLINSDFHEMTYQIFMRNIILNFDLASKSLIAKDLKVENLMLSSVIAIALVGVASFGFLISTYFNLKVFNAIALSSIIITFPIILLAITNSPYALYIYITYLLMGIYISTKDSSITSNYANKLTLIITTFFVISSIIYIFTLDNDSTAGFTFAVMLVVVYSSLFYILFSVESKILKIIQLLIIFSLLFLLPIVYIVNIFIEG